jgi:hypothetical protein
MANYLHEFPARVETPDTRYDNYRVLVEPASPGPWKATLYTKDAHLRGEIDRVSRVVPLGNRSWVIIGQDVAWRVSRVGGCGCTSSTGRTNPEVVAWLNDVVAQERWDLVEAR